MARITFLLLSLLWVLEAALTTRTVTIMVTATVVPLPSTGEPPSTDVVSSVETTAPEASETTVDTESAEASEPTETTDTPAQETSDATAESGTTAPEASGTADSTATEASGTETPSETTSAATDDDAPIVALYFTNWGIYGADYHASELPVDQITHVFYAFADIGPDGEVKSSDPWADTEKRYDGDSWDDSSNAYGCVGQLNLLKRKNRHLKLLLSVGGWTYSQEGKFVGPASTEEGRQRFASSAVKLVGDWGFDGLDIDWEYPENDQEAQNYVLLLEACRKALDEYADQHAPGYHFLLTVASSAGPEKIETMDLAGMDPLLDFWNLMAYDYAGSWDSTSGHQAAFYASEDNPESTKFSTNTAVKMYLESGIHPSKIVLGMPLYGRSFQDTDGLGKPFNGVGSGSIQPGVWLYKDLPRANASEHYIDAIVAAYSYDQDSRELISYDNRESVEEKAQWILSLGLGGGYFWEASGDRTGDSSLVRAFKGIIGGVESSENLISYPNSTYGNINGTEN